MAVSKPESVGLLQIFVYGTLKPGEENYQKYCAGKVVNSTRAVAQGKKAYWLTARKLAATSIILLILILLIIKLLFKLSI